MYNKPMVITFNPELIDRASVIVHNEWLKRNESWADPSLKLKFYDLPENEKEKDREHVRLVLKFINEGYPIDTIPDKIAAVLHEQWRRGYIVANGDTPRIKKVDGEDVNINVDWNNLHRAYKIENLAAGQAAVQAVTKVNGTFVNTKNASLIKTYQVVSRQRHVLGRDRNVTKVGRKSMITYKGKQICLTEARKLEKKLKKQAKDKVAKKPTAKKPKTTNPAAPKKRTSTKKPSVKAA